MYIKFYRLFHLIYLFTITFNYNTSKMRRFYFIAKLFWIDMHKSFNWICKHEIFYFYIMNIYENIAHFAHTAFFFTRNRLAKLCTRWSFKVVTNCRRDNSIRPRRKLSCSRERHEALYRKQYSLPLIIIPLIFWWKM